MERNTNVAAIILKTGRIAEIHKSISLLTPSGIVEAVAFGAQKGRLKGMTEVFYGGRIYLYHDPSKGSWKITDMDIKEYFEGIRGDIKKFYTASLWAEVIINSLVGNDEAKDVFLLFYNGLKMLNTCPKGDVSRISIQFLWHWLALSGFIPDLDECAQSGIKFPLREKVWYSSRFQGFILNEYGTPGMPGLSYEERQYLVETAKERLDRAVSFPLGDGETGHIQFVLYKHLETCLEVEFKTLKSAEGIL